MQEKPSLPAVVRADLSRRLMERERELPELVNRHQSAVRSATELLDATNQAREDIQVLKNFLGVISA